MKKTATVAVLAVGLLFVSVSPACRWHRGWWVRGLGGASARRRRAGACRRGARAVIESPRSTRNRRRGGSGRQLLVLLSGSRPTTRAFSLLGRVGQGPAADTVVQLFEAGITSRESA
jgi:hypothetical protein